MLNMELDVEHGAGCYRALFLLTNPISSTTV